MLDRITFDQQIMGGRACLRGLRITVALVVNLVANGMTTDQILAEYPDLEAEDIRQALHYVSGLASEEVHTFKNSSARSQPRRDAGRTRGVRHP